MMRRIALSILAVVAFSLSAFTQGPRRVRAQGPGPVAIGGAPIGEMAGPPVQGAPYFGTITNESVQTLADGNRIVQSTTGTIARDSQGRTRQDMNLPGIGNLSAANAPHLIFIHDPVAQTSYTLNLSDKTAQKMATPPVPPGPPPPGAPGTSDTFYIQMGTAPGPLPPPSGPMGGPVVLMTKDQGQVSKEDLGSQTMEGVFVTGVRTTRTIPAGQIGNEKAISIVTEVWTSPDLKTVVYSKRTDPRMGEQTFRLTGISRAEPDASLFTVPGDFKVVEGPRAMIFRRNQ